MKLNRVNTFDADVKFQLPGEGNNVWRPAEFKATFKSLPNDELDDVRVEQEEHGQVPGLLERILVDVQGVETDEKREDGTPYTPREVVIINQFSANALLHTFWQAVGRDVKAKNSKTSRSK